MKTLSLTLLLTLFTIGVSVSPLYALVFGGSNLGIFGYPSHRCTAPYSKPSKPYSFNSQWEIDEYNSDIDRYNSQMREYINCINEYVENAKNDIKRIKEKANEAISEANSR